MNTPSRNPTDHQVIAWIEDTIQLNLSQKRELRLLHRDNRIINALIERIAPLVPTEELAQENRQG